MTPASATGRLASAITSIAGSSPRSTPSSVCSRSPSAAWRTRISRPRIVARSKKCTGWPSSSRTRFDASTTLLIERSPHSSSRRTTQDGDGPTVTPRTTRAVYRPQRSGASIVTAIASATAAPPASGAGGRATSVAPKAAATSRATPRCPRASGRFAGTSRSRTVSSPWTATASTVSPRAVSRRAISSAPDPVATSSPIHRTEISIARSCRELPEEAHVVLDQETQVVDAESHHRDPIDAETERETRVPLGVDPHGLEHRRVHHSGAPELEPAGVLARAAAGAAADAARDVELAARLDEGEVAGTKPDLHVVAEESPPHRGARSLEVRKRHPLVDDQRLQLVEHGKVGRVEILPVDPTGADHSDRRLRLEHRPDLD